jgi:hypothetical protein
MPITPYSSSDLTRSKNNRQIYSGYRINLQASQLGIPGTPTAIKGPSRDIVQALREGPTNFTPAELTAILNNNSGSTAASGPPPGPTPLTFTSIGTTLPSSYTILTGYTQLVYVIIGGGGGGGDDGYGSGLGGGSGGKREGTVPIVGGTTISISLGLAGMVGNGFAPEGGNGTPTSLTVGSSPAYTATGGEGNPNPNTGGAGGVPDGVTASNSGGAGGALPAPYQAYGRGGNGGSLNASSGTDGYYSITLT